MSKNATNPTSVSTAQDAIATVLLAGRLRIKTPEVCRILSCNLKTLRKWEKGYPELFAPVYRQRNGNIYRAQQVAIMADVMDGLMEPQTGVELWERTQKQNENRKYREAGDSTR